MSGALIELVSKGVQDVYLTGEPQVSFFRQNYKRHTNFAMKPVELKPVGSQGANQEVSIPIESKGDLLTYIWCDATPGRAVDTVTQNIQTDEQNTPTEFSLWIGGVEIDRNDAFYLDSLWSKFLATSSTKHVSPTDLNAGFFPLHFFNCDNYTTPIPLVALQYHKVEIRMKQGPNINSTPVRFYANYIMLDTDERKFFTEQNHEYLITQVQRTEADATGCDLTYLNHPVKALLWGQSTSTTFVTNDVQLRLNGTDVFDRVMPRVYFNWVTMYNHSEYAPYNSDITADTSLYMYPFSLYPNRHQPTGTVNFSRLDNGKITWTASGGTSGSTLGPSYVYAVNYNILRIKDGLGGLAFSN